METPPFSSLGLSPELLQAVENLGFESPSPIQAMAIPVALEGHDVVGLSETGSGKTAAFGLPVLQKIDISSRKTQALIVCPTRELAVQVCEQVHILGAPYGHDLLVAPVYGGASMERQFKMLKRGAQIVVGTPGRLLDLWRRGALRLDETRIAVLDEADRMLDMGFRDEMEEVLGAMPADRQTLFFSATMNRQVEGLIQGFGKNPRILQIERKSLTVDTVDQSAYEVRQRSKVEVLSRLLDMESPRLAIIFCNTKRSVDECTEALSARGYSADRLHGDITQHMRERVLRRFRDGTIELLVATDVAARGLDVDDVDIVFNYDLPQDPEDYVHRIGRTGRAGKSGKAISFVFGRDIYRIQNVERYTRQKIRRERIPTQEQVEGHRSDKLLETVRETLEKGEQAYGGHEDQIDRLLESGHNATDIAAAAFTLLAAGQSRDGEEIAEDRPGGSRNPRDRNRDRGDRGDRGDRNRDSGPRRERRERRDNDAPGRPERPRQDRDSDRDNRPERPPRNDRPDHSHDSSGHGGGGNTGDSGGGGGMVKLFVSVGKMGGLRPGDLAGMIYREANLPDGSVGQIALFPKHSLVDVRQELADQVISSCRNSTLRGRPFTIDFDKGPRD